MDRTFEPETSVAGRRRRREQGHGARRWWLGSGSAA